MSTGRNSLKKPYEEEQRNSQESKKAGTPHAECLVHFRPVSRPPIQAVGCDSFILSVPRAPSCVSKPLIIPKFLVLRPRAQPASMMRTLSGSFGSPPSSRWRESLFAALFGVSLHLFYYVRGHHEPQSLSIVIAHLLLFPAISITATMVHGLNIVSLKDSFGIWLCVHLGLIVSMALYRVLFHPLRRIPGPFWAKITKIPSMVIARRGKLHELQTEWARKYGPIVRIGQYDRVPQCHRYFMLSS